MAETPLKNKIISWLKGYDYWFQYAGNQLLEGENVSAGLVDTTYQLFKEDYNLKAIESKRADIEYNEIVIDAASVAGHLQLQLIKEIENVNAPFIEHKRSSTIIQLQIVFCFNNDSCKRKPLQNNSHIVFI